VRVSIQALLQVDPAERPADCNELLGYLAEDEDDLYPSTVGIGDLPPATLPPFDPGPTWLPASSRLGLMVAEIVRDNATVEVHRSTMGTAGMLFGSSPDLAAPPPPESSRRGAVLPLLAGAALLGAVALGVWVGQSRQAPVVGAPVAPAPARTESQPVVDPPVHELAPAPAPAPAELVEPEPVVEAPPTPQPVRVAPAPVAPRPVPPEPPPAATSTAVTFEGADEMWLSDSGGARHQGSVGPGEYRILAKFPGSDEEVSAGIVEVTDQDALHVVCNGMMRRCAAH
jgi:hypothetical protein